MDVPLHLPQDFIVDSTPTELFAEGLDLKFCFLRVSVHRTNSFLAKCLVTVYFDTKVQFSYELCR